ncbi:hypothetical protein [Lactiplantibacillus plantarum]|uniref:hypothetical protein n=1 Tax=Lactiplantibacillus plantarum TaxID=1590 RepID=UPI00201304B3|nr:hypothetical protein [Lactiplantibacillus plantarum]
MTNEISNRHNYGLLDPFWNNFGIDGFNRDSMSLHGELKADISESPKAYKAIIETPGLTKKKIPFNGLFGYQMLMLNRLVLSKPMGF